MPSISVLEIFPITHVPKGEPWEIVRMKLAGQLPNQLPTSRSAPFIHPAACCRAFCSPAGPCDVRGVMLHLGPGAFRKQVPPSPDVPSWNTVGWISTFPYGE
jgi:hypothetical protein